MYCNRPTSQGEQGFSSTMEFMHPLAVRRKEGKRVLPSVFQTRSCQLSDACENKEISRQRQLGSGSCASHPTPSMRLSAIRSQCPVPTRAVDRGPGTCRHALTFPKSPPFYSICNLTMNEQLSWGGQQGAGGEVNQSPVWLKMTGTVFGSTTHRLKPQGQG